MRAVEVSMFPDLRAHKAVGPLPASGPGGHNIVTPKRARRHHSKLLVFTHDRR